MMNQKIQISFQKSSFLDFEEKSNSSTQHSLKLLKIMKRRTEVILPVFAVVWNETDTFSFKVSV